MKPLKSVLIIGLMLFVAAYFTATQPLTPALAVVSSLSVIVFAMPSYRAVIKNKGMKRGIQVLMIIGIYALVIESLAIHTGFPYGNFTYTDLLGNKIFGLTPWTVAFAYPPILMLSYGFARSRQNSRLKTLLLAAVIAMLVDLVLDPAAVRLGFWYWDKPGFYYGVPLINFMGWLLSGFIGTAILHHLWGHESATPPALAYSGLATLWFWTAVNIWLGLWLPALIGILILVRIVNYKTATIKR